MRDDFDCFVGWASRPKACIFKAGGTPHKNHPQIVERHKLSREVFGGWVIGDNCGCGLFGIKLFAFIHVEVDTIAL